MLNFADRAHLIISGRIEPMDRAVIVLALTLGAALVSPARAEDTFYLGTWKFVSAVAAPWADAKTKPDEKEKNALIGKTVTLGAKQISGPKVFVCKGPHYKVSDFTADMLFQGSFGEMHDADKSVDPLKLAAALGFTGTSFKTVETGCEIDWHFVDPTTAEIGLDNWVFTLKKQ
jgi:hypothetical protein